MRSSESKQAWSNAIITWLLPDTVVLIKQAVMSMYLGRNAKWNPYCKLPAGFKRLSPEITGIATAAVRVADDFPFFSQFNFFFKVSPHYCCHAASFCIASKSGSWNFPNTNFSSSRKTKRKWQYCLKGLIAWYEWLLSETHLLQTSLIHRIAENIGLLACYSLKKTWKFFSDQIKDEHRKALTKFLSIGCLLLLFKKLKLRK